MKKILISAIAAMSLSSIAMAGGDIVEEVVVEQPVVEVPAVSDSGFYIGGAYGYGSADEKASQPLNGGTLAYTEDFNYNSIMIDAGYKFNKYIAVEARYWFGFDEGVTVTNGVNKYSFDASVDTFGIYVKPMYPVLDNVNVYGLLGYASSDFEYSSGSVSYTPSEDYDGFSWGIGADYKVTDKVSVFVDYVSMYDDDHVANGITFDERIDTWNFGVNYKF